MDPELKEYVRTVEESVDELALIHHDGQTDPVHQARFRELRNRAGEIAADLHEKGKLWRAPRERKAEHAQGGRFGAPERFCVARMVEYSRSTCKPPRRRPSSACAMSEKAYGTAHSSLRDTHDPSCAAKIAGRSDMSGPGALMPNGGLNASGAESQEDPDRTDPLWKTAPFVDVFDERPANDTSCEMGGVSLLGCDLARMTWHSYSSLSLHRQRSCVLRQGSRHQH
jgi:hypothetical protein